MKTNFHYPTTFIKVKVFSCLRYVILISCFAGMTSTSSGFELFPLLYGRDALGGTTSLYNNYTNISCSSCSDGWINLEFHMDSNLWFDNLGDAQSYLTYFNETGLRGGFTGNYIGQGHYIDGLLPGDYFTLWVLPGYDDGNPDDYVAPQVLGGHFQLNAPYSWLMDGNVGMTNEDYIGTNDTIDFTMKTNSIDRIRVKKDGKIGVGTANPQAQLHINSGSNASLKIDADTGVKAIQVNNGGTNNFLVYSDGRVYSRDVTVYEAAATFPDYVFDADYKLQSLNELEKYLAENKHLPNIPTATEVGKDGLSIGKMQEKLLEKIEQLSLYIIDLNKQVQDLKCDNAALKEVTRKDALNK